MNDRIYYSREAEERANRERTASIMVFLAIGLGIGTVLALMFAPNPGEETRKELLGGISETTGPALSRIEKELHELRRRVEDRIGDLR